MPPRPFPRPYNVGIDICNINRIKRLLQRRPGPKPPPTPKWAVPQLHHFLARSFSFREILLFSLRPGFIDLLHKPNAKHDDLVLTSAFRYLAGRFAAKEAVIKAVHPRRVLLKDVLVAVGEGGQPYAIVLDESPILTQAQRIHLNRHCHLNLPTSIEDHQSVDTSPSNPDLDPGLHHCEGQVAKLSISHDGEYATAVCLAVEQTDALLVGSILKRFQETLAEIRAISDEINNANSNLLQCEADYFTQRNKQRKQEKRRLKKETGPVG